VYKVRDLETDEIVALQFRNLRLPADPTLQEISRKSCVHPENYTQNVCRIYDSAALIGGGYGHDGIHRGREPAVQAESRRVFAGEPGRSRSHGRFARASVRPMPRESYTATSAGKYHVGPKRHGENHGFRVARLIQGNGPLTGTIVGHPCLHGAEQAELRPVGACTDIYALAWCFMRWSQVHLRSTATLPVAVALKQVGNTRSAPGKLFELSPPIEAAIWKCLQKDTAKRFQSVNELEAALERAARATPVAPGGFPSTGSFGERKCMCVGVCVTLLR